jgi:hemoglobin
MRSATVSTPACGAACAYWAEALRGPRTYSECYGDETTVVRMHSGNGEHDDMDRRPIACFDQALADDGLAGDEVLRQVLRDYFAWATTTTMSRYHESAGDVPAGLTIPRWSWDGLQAETDCGVGRVRPIGTGPRPLRSNCSNPPTVV